MKVKVAFAVVITALTSMMAAANDRLLQMEHRAGAITIIYNRLIHDFDANREILASGTQELKVLVTTASGSPSPPEYEAAVAYADAIKSVFPNARLTFGRSGITHSDYYYVVQSDSGHDTQESDVPIYNERTSGVRCTNSYGRSIECRESSASTMPAGTRTMRTISRYVDTNIILFKSNHYDDQNARVNSEGESVVWKGTIVAHESFTVAYKAGDCSDDASATASISRILASRPVSEGPRKFSIQARSRDLSCDRR